MATFHFELLDLPPEAEALRGEVREFLRETLGARAAEGRARSWGGFDREFSRKEGARGWIGMVWPKPNGGHGRSALERYVVLEEMLAAGARSPSGISAEPCGGRDTLMSRGSGLEDCQLGPVIRYECRPSAPRAVVPRSGASPRAGLVLSAVVRTR